jgi:hypothetical protein
LRLGGIRASDERELIRSNERIISHRDHPSARVTLRIAERVKLFEEYVPYSRFFAQFPERRLFQRLALPEEPTRNCMATLERWHAALHQQDLQRSVPDRENDDVNGHS